MPGAVTGEGTPLILEYQKSGVTLTGDHAIHWTFERF
jgi:hypothetical protein